MTQGNKFAISLQYLKKEVRNRGHFWHVDKRQSFYKFLLTFLMEVLRHVQNTRNRKLVKLSQLLCVLLGCKTFRYFTGVQSCSLLLVFAFFLKHLYFQYNIQHLSLYHHNFDIYLDIIIVISIAFCNNLVY